MDNKDKIIGLIASFKHLPIRSVRGVVGLLDEGATIPFISRYRKEMTGEMDEEQVGVIKLEYERLTELIKRRETILRSIEEQDKLTDQLRERIEACYDSAQLEDIYLPYRPKRRTRATIAREKGLEPLAAIVMRQDGVVPERAAEQFLNDDVVSVEDALAGASDIIAEWVNESEASRASMRKLFEREADIVSRVVKDKEEAGAKFSDYFDSSERLHKTPSHRLLAMVRGEREGFLRLAIAPDESRAFNQLDRIFIRNESPSTPLIEAAIEDSYRRLLRPSMETEMMSSAKERADKEAIEVFAKNLRQLLLSPPLGQKRLLAIDPGFRSGCKVVCLDRQGALLHNQNIYPHPPQKQYTEAIRSLSNMIEAYKIETIAIGDGTAGRETEKLIRDMVLPHNILVFMVNEDGASVYSASSIAREEFPDYDVTVRGAVSIGRRLVDPLAELVKIDPKSIGVGQYQHDVDQNRLKTSLDSVVESCVNHVGVNLNTASAQLLSAVSGLGDALARNIIEYRAENGVFSSRAQLKKVPRLGPKAYELAAGFLRIPEAKHPLDNSAVHPESYPIVERMAKDLGVGVEALLKDGELRKRIDINHYTTQSVGIPTLTDIMNELSKPGRDPRGDIKPFSFSDEIQSIEQLKEGMVLSGIITNITNFGAFVDLGIGQDGLVHISQLADRYVQNPNDVVKLQQQVTVRVVDIDLKRGRIALSMKGIPTE